MKKRSFMFRTAAFVLSLYLFLSYAPAVRAEEEYDSSGATTFEFTDTGITVSEGTYADYTIDGTALTLQGAGTYIVSGSCRDGSITVKKGTSDVTLVLNGLTLISADTAPIVCTKSTGVTLVAAAGSVNTLTDAALNNDDNYPDNANAENAVLKCKDGSQVTLTGSGTLNITANGKNGIKSGETTETEGEAWLVIQNLTLNIQALVNDAINAEATLRIPSGQLTIEAADDGIHSDYELTVGAADTTGPVITITDCYEGLEAAVLTIASGQIQIHAQDDCLNAANSDLGNYSFALNISGGSLWMDTESGDGIDSNGTLTISGGTVVVWTANAADNQPLDADGTITVSGGTILAAGGSTGMGKNLSASQPYVTFGGGMDGQPGGMGGQPGGMNGQPGGMGGQPGGMDGQPRNTSDESFGGSADEQPPERPDGQTQQPPDISSGSMPNASSAVSIAAGNTITVQDASGNTVFSDTAPCRASYVFFSSPELTSGSTYTLFIEGTEAASAEASTEAGNAGGQMPVPNVPGERPSEDSSGGSSSDSQEFGQTGTNRTLRLAWFLFLWPFLAFLTVSLIGGLVVWIVLRKKHKQ